MKNFTEFLEFHNFILYKSFTAFDRSYLSGNFKLSICMDRDIMLSYKGKSIYDTMYQTDDIFEVHFRNMSLLIRDYKFEEIFTQ